MKRLVFIFIATTFYHSTIAQEIKMIELFDLINIFLPDESMDYNAYDWFTGKDKSIPILWKTDGIEWKDNTAYKTGEAVVLLNGSYFSCTNTKMEPCKWTISLKGSRAGYTSFSIKSVYHSDIGTYVLGGLFYKAKYSAKLIKNCDKDPTTGYYLYKLSIPGKKESWLKYEWSCFDDGCCIIINCYTDQNEIDLDCFTE
jgi:hypothetical protein